MLNKKGVVIPIAILCVLVIFLVVFDWFYLNTKIKEMREVVYASAFIDDFFIQKKSFDYYSKLIFERALSDFEFEQGKEILVQNILKELESFKDKNGKYYVRELKQIEEQVENIELNEKGTIWDVRINFVRIGKREGKEIIRVSYEYEKKFKKVFK